MMDRHTRSRTAKKFLSVRIPTGDVGRKCLNLHNAVNVTDEFMQAVKQGKEWHLKDPNDGTIRETMPARKLWENRSQEKQVVFILGFNRENESCGKIRTKNSKK